MTNEIFLTIVKSIITILMGLISAYLIPWIKSKISQAQLDQIDKYLELAVRCANQIYTPEEWEKKKEYVMAYMLNLVNSKFTLSLSIEDIDLMIEGMVNSVKESNK